MLALPKNDVDNVIELTLINGKLSKKEEVRYNKDGSIDKRYNSKKKGVSSEVYAFDIEEIKNMIKAYEKHINEAQDENKRQIACRNKMLFLIGINIGLRASDLVTLKWNFFFDDDGKFREFYKLQPKKQRKQGKFVPLCFNQSVKKAITEYIEKYPIESMDDYLFKSRKGNGAITEKTLYDLIKDTAKEIGIKKNIGSHSLRKTFGHYAFYNAKDKDKALITLQMIFNHSDMRTTMKYIGLLNEDMEEVFNNLDLGLDYI